MSGIVAEWQQGNTITGKGKEREMANGLDEYEAKSIQQQLSNHGHHRALAHQTATDGVSSSATGVMQCKFHRAGCDFTGPSSLVHSHEVNYCTPLYSRIAQLQTTIKQLSGSQPPSSSSSACSSSSVRHASSSPSSAFTNVTPRPAVEPRSPSLRAHPFQRQPSFSAENDITRLRSQIERLQSDLAHAQSLLSSEKQLRTERLLSSGTNDAAESNLSKTRKGKRKGMDVNSVEAFERSERGLIDLMSTTSLDEGKIEVLKLQLQRERTLKEEAEAENAQLRSRIVELEDEEESRIREIPLLTPRSNPSATPFHSATRPIPIRASSRTETRHEDNPADLSLSSVESVGSGLCYYDRGSRSPTPEKAEVSPPTARNSPNGFARSSTLTKRQASLLAKGRGILARDTDVHPLLVLGKRGRNLDEEGEGEYWNSYGVLTDDVDEIERMTRRANAENAAKVWPREIKRMRAVQDMLTGSETEDDKEL